MDVKKIVLSAVSCICLLNADTTIMTDYGITDYDNSKQKIDGRSYNIGLVQTLKHDSFRLNYENALADRIGTLPTLKIEKVGLLYKHQWNESLGFKGSILTIGDNIAPTDDGNVYGIGASYRLDAGVLASVDYYYSDYQPFNVHQWDAGISKGFSFEKMKIKTGATLKHMSIEGERYGNYVFKDDDYTAFGLSLAASYEGYYMVASGLWGKRLFAVMDEGLKVQHHAYEQDKSYTVALGKKFGNLDASLRYAYLHGDELPENRNDVTTQTTSLILRYTF